MKRALLASRNPRIIEFVVSVLGGDYTFDQAGGRDDCLGRLEKQNYDLLFIELSLIEGGSPASDHSRDLKLFRDLAPSTLMFVLCPDGQISKAPPASSSAAHYLAYPLSGEQFQAVVNQILQASKIKSELGECQVGFLPGGSFDLVAFSSSQMRLALDRARAVAGMESTVLLTGETGTGKSVLARIIHCLSPRRDKPFVTVQCSAIPETLLESELFGHEKGAFTDAVRTKPGKFENAQGGTLFLDEIGTITPATQVKLLQVLQEKWFQHVGGDQIIKANVRILAATNSDLRKLIAEGAFRSDLYYRLNVFPIELPALRDRRDDIPALAHIFLKKLNRLYSKSVLAIDALAMEALQSYHWPGNIRELENIIERAYILEPSGVLTRDSFAFEALLPDAALPEESLSPSLTLRAMREQCVRQAERSYLVKLLSLHQGRIAETAQAAGVGVRQLHKLLTKHGIHKEDFRVRRAVGTSRTD